MTARRAWSAMSRRKFMTELAGKQQYGVATAEWGWVYMERWRLRGRRNYAWIRLVRVVVGVCRMKVSQGG